MNGFTNTNVVPSTKRKLVIVFMAGSITLSGVFALSGCGVRSGMEKADDASQAKKQAEQAQDKLQKDLKKGRDH